MSLVDGQQHPGLNLGQLSDWMTKNAIDTGGTLSAELLVGGKSNLTYTVTDGVSTWIVRRPPLGHVLATAHDMAREYRVMSALRDTDVPVPLAYGLCNDPAVIGAPFCLMEHVVGKPYLRADQLAELGPTRTRAISVDLVDALVRLHSVEPDSVGLGDFGRPSGFARRQVERWKKQLDASKSRDLPRAEELYRVLSTSVPEGASGAIIHGDYRLDNVLTDSGDRLVAIIDWEMATLGDPLTDLALMLTYDRLGPEISWMTDVAAAPGYLSEAEIIERYATKSGRDLSEFGFYLGLAAFKLAAILEGIHHRHLHGKTVGEGFEDIGASVEPVLESGLFAVRNHHR